MMQNEALAIAGSVRGPETALCVLVGAGERLRGLLSHFVG